MWKETLLQILIACLPVFMFMVWYSKSERTAYSSAFLGIGCGIAMLLNTQFSTVIDYGAHFDLRHVPFLVGSLYGGFIVSFILLMIYVAAMLYEISQQWEYVVLFTFLLTYVPVLFLRIQAFHTRNRGGKFKIVLFLSVFLSIYQAATYFVEMNDVRLPEFPEFIGVVLIFCVLFVALTLICVHFIELGFERIQLQLQLYDVSMKYRKEMRRLQQFIDNSPLMVVFCDTAGRITHVNDLTMRHVSLGRNEVLGQNFGMLLEQMNAQVEVNPVDRIMQGEEKWTELLRVDGRAFYTVCCSIREMPSQGTDGVLFIGHDVTELQQLKDEVDRMERLSLVGQMAASITHEIRNPMAVIRGFVQLLNERSPVEQQSYFRIVLEELDRANSIINDFLSLAQNRIVEKEPANLNELLNELLPLIWADANMRGQMIELGLAERVELIPMNSKEMKQLVLNLSRNGMEAMSDKGVLRIETEDLGDVVQLRVVDHGVGIPPEKLERLFEPFFTTKANGTGLGLALCLSIVERHNGKIQVESQVGEGTTFIVSFCKPGRACW
ncbi:nitrogen regulation protein NR(II) [Paenibacillaceae bacterium WGS1546]|uniref:two-component system sensor histidine kinase NtrB n=1 Tax=Cohnella sp. WGS1546 TaxID=3366810 RepID=UPI00372D1582